MPNTERQILLSHIHTRTHEYRQHQILNAQQTGNNIAWSAFHADRMIWTNAGTIYSGFARRCTELFIQFIWRNGGTTIVFYIVLYIPMLACATVERATTTER